MAEKSLDLFETIHAYVGCEYISDLPCIAKDTPANISRALAAISPADYPLSQWNDALNYLVKAPAQETAEEAYACLLSALSEAEATR